MVHEVFWFTQKKLRSRMLMHDTYADVVVVGGGVSGLICAQTLREKGAQVVLLESDFCGSGESGRGFGLVSHDFELGLRGLIRRLGISDALRVIKFGISGSEKVRSAILDFNIQCDYQLQRSLLIAESKHLFPEVAQEHKARIDLQLETTLYDRFATREVMGSKEYGSVGYPSGFSVNGYLFCQGLKEKLGQSGVRVYEQTPVTGIDFKSGVVNANGFHIRASKIVVCADENVHRSDISKTKVCNVQKFFAISRPLKDFQIEQIFPENNLLVRDVNLLYHCFRVTSDNRLLVGGSMRPYYYSSGNKFQTSHMGNKLAGYITQKFPRLGIEMEYVWPSRMNISYDYLPLAGRDKHHPDLFFVSAAGGIAWAAALGEYIAEKVTEGRDEVDDIISLERKMPVSSKMVQALGRPLSLVVSEIMSKIIK